jgi:3'-phosphoadenosine 5'-phosphosulfate sulfotransferase (PAPS reductase)/FAD synthetase
MLWRVLQSNGGLPDEAVVCFANTGKEDEATLRFVRDCSVNWGVPITWLEFVARKGGIYKLVNFDTASRNGEPYEALIKEKKFTPNSVMRFCTEELKIKPIQAFTGLEDDETMVGIRADENHRIPKMRKRGLLIPLVTAKVTKNEVRQFWKNQAFDLELEERDGVTQLGNCDLCFLKPAGQIYGLIQDKPSRGVWWAKMEQEVGGTFHKDRPSYASMLQFTEEQRNLFDPAEEAIACFCGD